MKKTTKFNAMRVIDSKRPLVANRRLSWFTTSTLSHTSERLSDLHDVISSDMIGVVDGLSSRHSFRYE